MEKTREELAIEALSNCGNQFSQNKEVLCSKFYQEHRTVQQGMGRTIFTIIKDVATKYDDMAQRSRYFDGRNEEFGRRCSAINAEMSKISEFWDYLPMV